MKFSYENDKVLINLKTHIKLSYENDKGSISFGANTTLVNL